ncbi:MAG: sugar ABC transporter substrate-binding protein [Propionibacteriaceae bacterium]|nr:sugar ABC transporter substrate-binding protein [Propionibacteriaceae bacterium]
MKRRTFLAATAVSASAFGLAACGGNDAAPGGSDAPLSKDSAGELTLAYWDKNQTPTIEANVAAFNAEYPNIKVNLSLSGWDDYWTKLSTQASGSNLADVFWMNGPSFQLYASEGMLAELDGMEGVDWGNYPEALVTLYSYDGKHYGVPKDYDTIACAVDKGLFEQAGVDLPTEDWTWDDFKAAAKGVKDANIGVWGVTGGPSAAGQSTYYNSIPQAGGFVIKDGQSGYDDPKSIEGLKFWVDLIEEGLCPSVDEIVATEPEPMFLARQAAMYWVGSWQPKTFLDQHPAPEDLMYLPLPKKEKQASVIHGLSYAAAAGGKNVEAAKALIKYLTDQKANETEAANATAIPAYNGTQAKWLELNPDWDLSVFTKAAEEYSVPYPASKNTSAWSAKESEYLTPAFQLKTPIEEAAKQLADEMNTLLAAE